MKGETWEDIPGLGGYFLISNYGRVKRLRYELQDRKGRIKTYPEMIKKLNVDKTYNRFKKDYSKRLVTTMVLDGRHYQVSIARMVFYLFVKKFDYTDYSKVVLCKDANNFNIQPSNLELASISEKINLSLSRKRKNPDPGLSAEQKKQLAEAGASKLRKQVSQYNKSGKKIKTFRSILEAGKSTGIWYTSIEGAASKYLTAGGYYWRFGNAEFFDVKAFRMQWKIMHAKKHGQKVTQFDLKGKMIARYPSLKLAQELLGIGQENIHSVIKGKTKSAGGFFWKKGYINHDIDLSGHIVGNEAKSVANRKEVHQLSRDGTFIRSFPSLKAAAEDVGVTPQSIQG